MSATPAADAGQDTPFSTSAALSVRASTAVPSVESLEPGAVPGAASPFTVVVVPDSFKGSATAAEVAAAIADGLRPALTSVWPHLRIVTSPMADGGEGTLDAFSQAWSVEPLTTAATDSLGRPVTARYAVSPDSRTAVVEAAEANGLPLVSDVPLRAREATSRGVGDILGAALDRGVEEIVLCIGGSATTDGGSGLLTALGARFLGATGGELPPGGGGLTDLASIDVGNLDPRARQVRWRIACDVTNPLTGPRGAAAVFGPQKGAASDDVAHLDAGLARLAEVLREQTGVDVADMPGMGAAGGIAAVLHAVLGAELVPGADLVIDTLGLGEHLAAADLVVTGEGRLDEQSFDGKVISAVRRWTPAHVPVVIVAGGVLASQERIEAEGITAAVSIAPGPCTLDELSGRTPEAIRAASARVGRLLAAGHALGAAAR